MRRWRVRGTASLFVEGYIDAPTAEAAVERARTASTSEFEWFVGGGTDVKLGNNRLDAWAETLQAEEVDADD